MFCIPRLPLLPLSAVHQVRGAPPQGYRLLPPPGRALPAALRRAALPLLPDAQPLPPAGPAQDPKELSPWMAGLLRAYVHYHHRRTGFVGHLWQGRFNSPAVAVEDYFLSCARYIERNPLVAGLVAQPWQSLVKLPGVRAGRGGLAAVVQRLVPGTRDGGGTVPTALARVLARRRRTRGSGAARGLDHRRGGLPAAAGVPRGAPGAPPRPPAEATAREGFFPQFYADNQDT
jgi:hypothetical protein